MSLEIKGNRVMVDLDEVTQTEGGLYVPQTVSQQMKWGTVVGFGEQYVSAGAVVRPTWRKGQRILVDALGGVPVKYAGREYLVVRNEDVVGAEVPDEL